MSFGASNSRATIIAVWQVIRSVAQATSISIDARAALIRMSTELGQFIELLRKQDFIEFSDEEKRDFYKVCAESMGALDKHTATLSKPRKDASSVSDDQIALMYKVFSDLSRLVDVLKLSFSKSLRDQVVGLEDHAYVFAKKAPENFTDIVDRIETKGVYKPRSDASTVSDDDTVQLTKDRKDQAGFSDERFAFIAKVLTDSVNTTDDIDGAASIDDDQEVQFFKTIGDLTATQDVFYRFLEFVRNFSDVTSVTENSNRSVSKPFGDIVTSVGDYAYVLSRKTPDNVTQLDDTQELAVSKQKYDLSYIGDSKALSTEKPASDAAVTTDKKVFEALKVKSDNSSITDTHDKSMGKTLFDRVIAVDFLDQATIVVKRDFLENTVFGETIGKVSLKPLAFQAYSVSEYAKILSNKTLGELALLSEMLYRVTNKRLTDAYMIGESKAISAVKPTQDGFSLTDSGSLRSQSYCDFTYIAENYVGTSRTF